MAGIIGSTECKDVRAALDVSLDETALPDSVIQQTVYMQEAEQYIFLRLPAAKTYGDLASPYGTPTVPDWRLRAARNAAIYETAARIAPALRSILGKKWPNFELTYGKWDGAARAAELRGQRDTALALITEADGIPAPPSMFVTVGGTRGR